MQILLVLWYKKDGNLLYCLATMCYTTNDRLVVAEDKVTKPR